MTIQPRTIAQMQHREVVAQAGDAEPIRLGFAARRTKASLLANAQANAGLHEEAITEYRQALKISPSHPGAFSGLGHQLKTVGRQQESIEVYRQCISANARNTESYWSLANMKTFRFEDAEVSSMEVLLEDDSLDAIDVEQLCNALGFEYEGRNDY